MKIQFKCANCLHETNFSVPANITLVCQKCGCPDISFSHEVVITAVVPGLGKTFPPNKVPANEPFLGRTKYGEIWSVVLPPPPDKGSELKLRKK